MLTYRLYRRDSGFYYCQNNITGKQTSLGTTNKKEAEKLLHAKNEASRDQSINRAQPTQHLSRSA